MNYIEANKIDEGMIKCCNQATQLIRDADLLFENERFASAFSLYQLASEESSKIKILVRLAIEKRSGIIEMDEKRGNYFKKLFYSHKEKTRLGSITDQNFNQLAARINLPNFREDNEIEKEINNPKQLDERKQDGIYVSIGNNEFLSPFEIISEENCLELSKIVVFRHKRQKETMEAYLQNTEFYVKRFVEDTLAEYQKAKKNNIETEPNSASVQAGYIFRM